MNFVTFDELIATLFVIALVMLGLLACYALVRVWDRCKYQRGYSDYEVRDDSRDTTGKFNRIFWRP